MTIPGGYRGRFAPSPSGPLHFGSLVAALASYLDARKQLGEWLVRIEDVDETRTVKGAADDILRTLEKLGFEWDGPVVYQSQRKDLYREAIDSLLMSQQAYYCSCSRTDIARIAKHSMHGLIYPGTCRSARPPTRSTHSIRLLTNDRPITFLDRILGEQTQRIESEVGDFIIRRADGYTAYQLAVVLDDDDQAINQVVRGADLLHSTARQIYLQQLLGFTSPGYAHTPLVLDEQGRKLSKQDRAHPVSREDPLASLLAAWAFLTGEQNPPDVHKLGEFWQWTLLNWNIKHIQ